MYKIQSPRPKNFSCLCPFKYDLPFSSLHVSLGFAPPEPVFVNLLRCPEINSHHGGPVRQPYLMYRPARLHWMVESIPRNWFLDGINVYKYGLCCAGNSWGTCSDGTGALGCGAQETFRKSFALTTIFVIPDMLKGPSSQIRTCKKMWCLDLVWKSIFGLVTRKGTCCRACADITISSEAKG